MNCWYSQARIACNASLASSCLMLVGLLEITESGSQMCHFKWLITNNQFDCYQINAKWEHVLFKLYVGIITTLKRHGIGNSCNHTKPFKVCVVIACLDKRKNCFLQLAWLTFCSVLNTELYWRLLLGSKSTMWVSLKKF